MRSNLLSGSTSGMQEVSATSKHFKLSEHAKAPYNFSVLLSLIFIAILFGCPPPPTLEYWCFIRYTAQDWPYRYYCGAPDQVLDYSEYTYPHCDKDGNRIIWSEKTESFPVDGCFDCDVYSAIPQVIVEKPESRVYHDLLYDEGSNQILMLGGTPGWGWQNQCRDVWAYKIASNEWAQRSNNLSVCDPTGGQIESTSPVLIEDSGVIIVFNNLGETWSYSIDNDKWKNMNPQKAPSARFGHVMTYDKFHGSVILFGGSPKDEQGIKYFKNDTWIYNYSLNQWKEMQPEVRPRRRMFAGMAFNSNSNTAIMWGGKLAELNDNAMWEYDLSQNEWEIIPYIGAPPAFTYLNPKMMFDEQNNELFILYGIISSNDLYPSQLKEWRYSFKTNTWYEFEDKSHPPGVTDFAAVLDTKDRKVVLFGGFTNYDPVRLLEGTWILDLESSVWHKY
jgi:hypothetical protein